MFEEKHSYEKKEDIDPQIRLEFVRHDKHEGTKPDNESRLTREGRIHASETGKSKNAKIDKGFIISSPRKRVIETVAREFLANENLVSEEDSLEDILEKIKVDVGKKYKMDERLNFITDRNPEYKKIFYHHLKDAKDSLNFIYNESDKLIYDLGDAEDMSLSRFAGNIAEIIKKYIKIYPQWEKIYNKNSEPDKTNEIQRFLGSHSLIMDSFLLKVIEKAEGKEGVSNFLNSWKDKNGIVGLGEGFSVVIKKNNEKTLLSVSCGEKNWEISEEMLESIIEDKKKLDESVRNKIEK